MNCFDELAFEQWCKARNLTAEQGHAIFDVADGDDDADRIYRDEYLTIEVASEMVRQHFAGHAVHIQPFPDSGWEIGGGCIEIGFTLDDDPLERTMQVIPPNEDCPTLDMNEAR